MPPPGAEPARQRLAIAYHSAAGGTRLVAELLAELLSADHDATAIDIYSPGAPAAVAGSDFAVLCYPTYFLRPSQSIQEFIGRLPRAATPQPVFLLTTYELYTENSLRACARLVKRQGMAVMGTAAVRAPGTDVTVVLPDWLCPWLYQFERSLGRKLHGIADDIRASAQPGRRERIPAPKWYTPLAQLLQRGLLDGFFEWRHRVRVVPERCTACGACVSACDREAWTRDGEQLRHDAERCELCTRCIHRCPRNAIVLVDGVKDNKRLDARLYARLKAEARAALERRR